MDANYEVGVVFMEAFMKVFFASFGVFVIVPVLCAAGLQNSSQGKPEAPPAVTTAKSPKSETEEKNPIGNAGEAGRGQDVLWLRLRNVSRPRQGMTRVI